jgi:hypothetical protein
MAYSFPVDIYTTLEKQLGQEAALNLARSVEQIAQHFEEDAQKLAQQKKIEIRDEMSKELASKADIALVKAEIAAVRNELLGEIKALRAELLGEIKAVEARLDRKITIYMVILLCAIFLTNQDTRLFLLKVLGVVK